MTDPLTMPDPFVVGICYPAEWWRAPGAFDGAVAELVAIERANGAAIEVILLPYEEEHERRAARGADPSRDWTASQPPIEPPVRDGLGRAHALLALDLPANIVELAPQLQWVQAFGAGSDQLVSCGLNEAGIRLTSSAGSNAVGIAEFALGRIIEHYKRLPDLRQLQDLHQWKPVYGRELNNATLGLIGFGNICAAIAPRASAFGMRVIASRASAQPGDTDDALDQLYPAAHLHEMLGASDIVVAAVPDSPATRGLMDADAFAAMRPGSFFCNVGRGTLVDESALVAALESGQLGGAALDVASSEPLPEGHPIWTAPNLALSFHNAAVPAAMFDNVHRIFADNLQRFLTQQPLINEV